VISDIFQRLSVNLQEQKNNKPLVNASGAYEYFILQIATESSDIKSRPWSNSNIFLHYVVFGNDDCPWLWLKIIDF